MKWNTWTRLSRLTLVPFFRRNTNLTFTSKPLLQMTRRTLLQVCLSNVVVSISCDWLPQVHSDICSVLSSHSLCFLLFVLRISTNSSYDYRVSLNYQTSIFLCNWCNSAWKLRVVITYIYTVSHPELTYKARKELHKAARRFLEISSRLLLESLDGKKQ